VTRGEIRAAVISNLRETTPPVRWTLDELNRYLDDGYRDLAERTAAVVRTFTIFLQPGQNYADFPSFTDSSGTFDVLHPLAVKDQLSDLPLDPVHWSFIDGQDRIWVRTSDQRPHFYGFWDWQTLLVYPHYGAIGGLGVIAAMMPRGFANDSAVPEVPTQYHDALIHYVAWRCLLKGAKGSRYGRASVQLRNYSEKLRVPADLWGSST
jgi:hypothetical protein